MSVPTSRTVTGLTNGTAYTFRVAAVSGIGQGPWSAASGSVTPGGDPLFAQVALLLHMDGTGSTFVDSSKYARAITASGDVTQSTAQSKFGGKSAAFDGTGDALTIPYSSSLDLATGDFAIECWWYPTSTANGQTLFAFNGSGPYSQVRVDAYNDGSRYFRFLTQSGGDWISTAGGGAWNVNQWHHVAAVRTGSQFNLYIDGTSAISFAASGSLANNSSGVAIGSLNGGNYWVSGYIDEFRATVGHNRGYTGSTITVPTAAFPEATPGTDPWISDVALLLHMDGANGSTSFTDSSPSPRTISAFGNAQISTTQSKFGGASCRLATTGDYLTFTGGQSIGTGDFCIEFFAYSSWSGPQMLFDFRSHAQLAMWTDGTGLLLFNSGSFATRATLTSNTWQHIAVTRQGSTLRLFVDGSLAYTTTDSSNFPHASGTNWIGKPYDANWSVPNLWLDEFRITIGSNRGYTGSTITVPTAAFPDA